MSRSLVCEVVGLALVSVALGLIGLPFGLLSAGASLFLIGFVYDQRAPE